MEVEQCTACGSFDTYGWPEIKTYTWEALTGYSSTKVWVAFNRCKVCGEVGDFCAKNDAKITAAGVGK